MLRHALRGIGVSLIFLGSSALAQESKTADLAQALQKLEAGTFPAASDEAKQLADSTWQALRGLRDQVNARDVAAWQAVQTRADWEKLRDARLKALGNSLYDYGPYPRYASVSAIRENLFATPNEPRPVYVTRTLPGDGFTVENLVYLSSYRPLSQIGTWVTANLYRPDPLPSKPIPAIVIVHSHHNTKTHGELQDMGMTWARQGCYVLIPDMLGHGERREHPFHTESDYAKPFKVTRQDYYFRYNLGMQLQFFGDSLMGWMVNDIKHGIDLLLRRPNIDRERIILLGSVAGGGDQAAVAAALDTRIKGVVPFNFGGVQVDPKVPSADRGRSANYVNGGSWESTRNLAFSGRDGFLPWLIVGSAAPRPLLYAHEFAWDFDRDPVWQRYQKIYGDFYQAGDRLGELHGRGAVTGRPPEATHCNNIGAVHRQPMYPLLEKWFSIPIPEKEYTQRTEAKDLQCWTPELRDKLKPQKVHEILAAHVARWSEGNQEAFSLAFPRAVPVWERWQIITRHQKTDVLAGAAGTWLEVVGQKSGLRTTALVLIPASEKKGQELLVLALARRGRKGFLENRSETIAELLQRGIRVCLVDLLGQGETGPGPEVGRTSAATALASFADVVGASLPDVQEHSLKFLLDHLQTQPGQRFASIPAAFWLDSFAPANDPKADLRVPHDTENYPITGEPMNNRNVLSLAGERHISTYIRGGLADFDSILRSPFLYLPYDFVPRRGFELNMDLMAYGFLYLGQAHCRAEAMIDAQNRLLSAEDLRKAFPRSIRQAKNEFTFSAEPSSPPQLAKWFEDRLRAQRR